MHLVKLSPQYENQTGCISGSAKFRITRGVRQGDIVSPLLLKAALKFTLRSWKSRLGDAGIAWEMLELTWVNKNI